MPIDPNIALQVRTPEAPNLLGQYGQVAQIQNLQRQQQLLPGQLQAQQMENQQRQNQLNEYQGFKAALAKHNGDFDSATPDILAAAPTLGTGIVQKLIENKEKIAQTRKADADAAKAQLEAAGIKATHMAQALDGLDTLPPEQQEQAYQQRKAVINAVGGDDTKLPDHYDPAAIASIRANGVTAQQQIDAAKLKIQQQEEARATALQPGKLAEAKMQQRQSSIQELPTVTDQQSYEKWLSRNPSMGDIAPPSYSADNIAKIQRIAVPVKDQPEFDINTMKARMGLMGNSEYDQFLAQYAKSVGKTPATLTPEEGLKSFQKYAETKQDPVMRANAIAQGNLAIAMKQLTLGQMPTKEDASMLADDIRNHRLAPDQLSQIRGRGNGQLGLMVEREMKAKDPQFNWEEASSEYQLAKTPGFQQTVRYMDSVQNSIPQLQQAADALNNGRVRSINALVNAGKNQFNNIDLKKFQADRALVGDEIAKILQGGGTGSGTSDAKLKQAQDLISQTDSPAAIATTLKEVNQLIGYRRQSLTRGTYLEGQAPAIENQQGGAAAKAINTKAEYDALPKGETYVDAMDGKQYQKK